MSSRRTVSEPARTKTKEVIDRRDAALAEIARNPDLKRVYEAEQAAYDAQVKKSLMFYWERGQHATEIKRVALYGQGAVELLADALMVDRSTIYKTIGLAAMYRRKEEIQAKIDEAVERGCRLGWSHFNLIVHVPDTLAGDDVHADRRKMVDLVIEHNLTVSALGDELKSRYRNGDPHAADEQGDAPPRSIGGVLKRIGTLSDKALTKFSETLDDLNLRLERIPAGSIREQDLELMDRDSDALMALAHTATEAARTLKQGAIRMRRERRTESDEPSAPRRSTDPRARRATASTRH